MSNYGYFSIKLYSDKGTNSFEQLNKEKENLEVWNFFFMGRIPAHIWKFSPGMQKIFTRLQASSFMSNLSATICWSKTPFGLLISEI